MKLKWNKNGYRDLLEYTIPESTSLWLLSLVFVYLTLVKA